MRQVNDSDWINGIKFAEWLERFGLHTTEAIGTHQPSIAKWRGGDNLSIWTADFILTKKNTGLSIHDIPDDFFVNPKPHAKPHPPR